MSGGTTLAGQTVVITGGAGGIGLATARAMQEHGARVALLDIDQPRLDAAAAALAAPAVLHCSALETPELCAAALDAVSGPIHALVHLAGVFEPDPLDPARHDVWDRAIAHNLTNAYDLSLAFMRRRAPLARIVLASSIAYRRGSVGHAAYSAAKGGIAGLTRALSRDLAPEVNVNAVAPGIIETRMTERIIAERGDAMLASIPLRRYGRADEVAKVIRFLCGPDASYITGQTITIDGGMTNA